MRIIDQPAYVLHARAWRETSLLLEVFTRDFGRVGLVARGVRGARARAPRSLLEPLQRLRLAWSGRGELPTLGAAEPDGFLPVLRGEALLAAMYVNELLVRLTARNDPHPRLFARYADWLEGASRGSPIAWQLRCLERDVLAAIGYAPRLDTAADSDAPIEPGSVYDYVPEQGAVAAGDHPGSVRLRGSSLLALAAGTQPDHRDMADLRRLMRLLIGWHVGERGLQSWRVLAEPLRPR